MESGVAFIKKEYILPVNSPTEKDTTKEETSYEPREKIPRTSSKKQKRSGRNYNRPKLIKEEKCNKLCRSHWSLLPGEVNERNPCEFTNCSFSHNIQSYIDNKAEDISDTCHNFDSYGFCPYGVTCRYGSKHIQSLGSRREEKKYEEYLAHHPVSNLLKKDVQTRLRKKTYDFAKAKVIFESIKASSSKDDLKQNNADIEANSCENSIDNIKQVVYEGDESSVIAPKSESAIGANVNEVLASDGIEDYGLSRKKINWKGKLYLAPLTTLGNLPFRRVCKKLGADITCGEMALATCLLQASSSEWSLVKKHSSEDCFGVQLCGSNIESMIKCTQLLEEQIEMDYIDINMGCPIDLIYKQGGGSALMRRTGALEKMIHGMAKMTSCPITLKMRTGVYSSTNVAHDIIEKAKLWDVSLVTLHGRSREQRYLKMANWDYIKECAKRAEPLPIFGNGDVLTYEDYYRHLENSNISGIMIARGALLKPWIFTEIKEKRTWDISSSERFEIIKEFVNCGLEHWGSDTEGVEKTRRFLLEWLSFLYRYIPVGLLERPQMINQRPLPYFGRNDLETLMASNKVKDWVTISEMLLGRVPENFNFLPKHQVNSWT